MEIGKLTAVFDADSSKLDSTFRSVEQGAQRTAKSVELSAKQIEQAMANASKAGFTSVKAGELKGFLDGPTSSVKTFESTARNAAAAVTSSNGKIGSSTLSLEKQLAAVASLQRQRLAAFIANAKSAEQAAARAAQAVSGDLSAALGSVSPGLAGIAGLAGPFTAVAAGLVAIGVAVVGIGAAIISTAGAFGDYGNKIGTLRTNTDLSADSLARLTVIGKETETDIDALARTVNLFGVNISKGLSNPASEAGQSLKLLNIDAKQLLQDSPEDRLQKVSKAILGVENANNRNRAGMALAGKGFTEMKSALTSVANGWEDAGRKANIFGLVLTDSQIDAANVYNDTIEDIQLAIQGFIVQAGSRFVPQLLGLLNDLGAGLKDNESAWVTWAQFVGETVGKAVTGARVWLIALKADIAGLSTLLATGSAGTAYNVWMGSIRSGDQALTNSEHEQSAMAAATDAVGAARKVGRGTPAADWPEGAKKGGDANKAKDEMAAYKRILDSVTQSLDTFGITTERAKVEQEFLHAGIEKLNPTLRAQAETYRQLALVIADTLDTKKALADNEKKQKQEQDDLEKVVAEVVEAIFRQGQAISDVESKYPDWLRNTYDFIVAKTREGFTWDAETKQIYLNNEARREQLRIIAEGATRGRFAALPEDMRAGGESRLRLATYERQQMQEAIERVREQMMDLGQDLTSIFARSVGDGFEQGAKRGLASLALGLLDIVQNVFLKKLAEGLGDIFSDMATGGGGGWLQKILGFAIGAVAGGVSLGGGSSFTPGGTGSVRPRIVGSRATGGPISAGNVYQVHRDELIMPIQDSMVYNKSQQGGQVVNNYSIVMPPTPRGGYASPQSKRQMAEHLLAALQGAQS